MIKNLQKLLPGTKNAFVLIIVLMVCFFASSFKKNNEIPLVHYHGDKDSLLSKQAFLKVYDVLMSPRCMNCHPSGDVPLQGEDSKLHTQNIKRGADGKGLYAVKCSNCHQNENRPGLHMPPGNPNWHLPPANMKMVFEGKSPRQLAAQLLNLKTNGHKTIPDLIKHISSDGLVLGGWNPGEGRKQPPLSHEEFTRQFNIWIENGAYLPEK